MILTLLKTIPSGSHNAPYSPELGEHWPAGHQFTLLPERRQASCRKFYGVPATSIVLEEVGGEETLISIPRHQMPELFGVEAH